MNRYLQFSYASSESVKIEILSLMMYKVELTLVTDPLSCTRFIPMAKHEKESTYISMDNTRIFEKTFSVPLGFGGIPSYHCLRFYKVPIILLTIPIGHFAIVFAS